MRPLLATSVLGPVLGLWLVLGAAAGCSRREAPAHRAPAAVPTVSVDELAAMLAGHEYRPVDVNGDDTRRHMGIIPGAVLLRDMDTGGDVVGQLPADKATGLVFYCASTACRASHEAAEQAIVAGYTRVRELPDGIAGWVKAGKPTTAI
jgi:rhodanese-related sulfurtransferase